MSFCAGAGLGALVDGVGEVLETVHHDRDVEGGVGLLDEERDSEEEQTRHAEEHALVLARVLLLGEEVLGPVHDEERERGDEREGRDTHEGSR